MKPPSPLSLVGLCSLTLVLLLSGCSKKGSAPEVDISAPGGEEVPTPVETPKTPEPEVPTPPPAEAQKQIEDVFFDYDRFNLRSEARTVLDDNADLLRQNPSWNLLLEGHCDERGTVEYNLALGQKRAQAVRDYLVGLGVDPARMRTISYGEERPFDAGHSESAWSRNRRVHFVRE